MNLHLRVLLVWLRNPVEAKRRYTYAARSRFRLLPHDLDALGRMNNGRHLQIMHVAGTTRGNRCSPVHGGYVIRSRRALIEPHYLSQPS